MFFFKQAGGGVEPIPGDLNLDQIVDGIDVDLGVRVILTLEVDPGIVNRMDMNLDGNQDVLDLQAIVNKVRGSQ